MSLRETQGLAKPLPKRYGQRFGILVTHRDDARSVAGQHPFWDVSPLALAADGRLVLKLNPTRAYGMVG